MYKVGNIYFIAAVAVIGKFSITLHARPLAEQQNSIRTCAVIVPYD